MTELSKAHTEAIGEIQNGLSSYYFPINNRSIFFAFQLVSDPGSELEDLFSSVSPETTDVISLSTSRSSGKRSNVGKKQGRDTEKGRKQASKWNTGKPLSKQCKTQP